MLTKNKAVVYFVSDFHLGTDGLLTSREREAKVIRFLEMISKDASKVYMQGDLFDYWFEYRRVIPKGYTRFLGKLAEMRDKGIDIDFFTGNHDVWMFRYFQEELNIPVHKSTLDIILGGKSFQLGHGDGLGPGDQGYKFIKKLFTNKILQRLYGSIHPNIGLKVMRMFSKKSREQSIEALEFLGPTKEWLVQHAEEQIKLKDYDYLIFGHRHLPIDYTLSNLKSRYINLGDWLHHCSYAKFDGEDVRLQFFENDKGRVYP